MKPNNFLEILHNSKVSHGISKNLFIFQPLYVQDNKSEPAKVSNKINYILSFEKLIKLLIPMLHITSYNVHYNELVNNIEFQTQH